VGANPKHAALGGDEELPHLVIVRRRQELLRMLTEERPQADAEITNDELLRILPLGDGRQVEDVLD